MLFRETAFTDFLGILLYKKGWRVAVIFLFSFVMAMLGIGWALSTDKVQEWILIAPLFLVEPALWMFLIESWVEFNSEEDSFKIKIPSIPQISKKDKKVLNYDEPLLIRHYISQDIGKKVTYVVQVHTFPFKLNVSKEVVNLIVENLVGVERGVSTFDIEQEDGGIICLSFETFNKKNEVGLESVDKSEFEMVGIVKVVKNNSDTVVYILSCVYDKEDFREADYERFIKSFEIYK